MHIAVLGGTFNPIHFGHLRAAEEVVEGLALDKVVFMPSSTPPHKPGQSAAKPAPRPLPRSFIRHIDFAMRLPLIRFFFLLMTPVRPQPEISFW